MALVRIRAGHVRGFDLLPGANENAGGAGAVLRGSPEFIGSAGGNLDLEIVGFRDRHQEASLAHRADIHAIRGDDFHRAACELDEVVGHRRCVDEPQPDGLSGASFHGDGRLAIGEEVVVGDVGQIHGGHPHHGALEIIGKGAVLDGSGDTLRGAFFDLLPLTPRTKLGQGGERRFISPVGENGDDITVGRDPLSALRRNDDPPVDAELLLKHAVGVIPIGARLAQREPVLAGLAGLDGGHVDMGNTVLIIGDEKTVPMDRGFLVKVVANIDDREVTFDET